VRQLGGLGRSASRLNSGTLQKIVIDAFQQGNTSMAGVICKQHSRRAHAHRKSQAIAQPVGKKKNSLWLKTTAFDAQYSPGVQLCGLIRWL
jgi:hypothetical protein